MKLNRCKNYMAIGGTNTNIGSGILVSVSCNKVVLRMQLHVFVLVKQYWQTIYN